MATASQSDSAPANQPQGLHSELDMALNIMRFATDAVDAELAQYVHGKACDSYRRLSKLSSQSQPEDMLRQALQLLGRRIQEFQARPATPQLA